MVDCWVDVSVVSLLLRLPSVVAKVVRSVVGGSRDSDIDVVLVGVVNMVEAWVLTFPL